MNKLKIFGKKIDGKLRIMNRHLLNSLTESLLENEMLEIIILKVSSKRSSNQNRLYRAYLDILGDYLGISNEELHEIIKMSILGTKKVLIKNKEFEYINSTTELTKEEFNNFLEKLANWSLEKFDFVLPPPDLINNYWNAK